MIELDKFNNDSFDRGAPLWKEGLWWLVRSIFFLTSLPVPGGFKVFLLRSFGASIGSGVVIRSRVNITFPWKFACQNNVWIGDDVLILSLDRVCIGSNVCISQRAFICTGSHDFYSTSFDLKLKPVTIKDHCWVGASSFISPGVYLSTGSRCLPGSVVTKNVAEEVTVGGVPASTLKKNV